MKRGFVSITCLSLAVACQAAHPGRSPGIERYPSARDLYPLAEAQRVKHMLPALGLGIVHRGQIVGLGMAGERVAGSGNWATIDDAFDIASCSKSVTATVAALLVEQKKVRWESTIAEVLPELKATMHPAYAGVTLEQLLGHRAGLDRIMDRNERWTGWQRQHARKTATEQRRLFAAMALQQPPRYPPGTDEYYCNDGYIIAGSMLERAAGEDWETLARTRLFQPLELKSFHHGVPTVVSGHEDNWLGRPRAIAPNLAEYGTSPFGSPAGFLACSVPDLLRYVDFHNRGENIGHPLLSRESFQRLHAQVGNQRYALGWEVEVKRDAKGQTIERSLYHGGYSGRYRANMWFAPETQWGTVIVMNHGRGNDSISADIFYALLREFGLLPAAPAAQAR
jgi:CubicO group peptidase (beta-lactamase class C family)